MPAQNAPERHFKGADAAQLCRRKQTPTKVRSRREGVACIKRGSSTLHQDIQDICGVDYTGVRDDRPTPAASKTDCTNSVLALL
jgi:hypothetical protein